VEIASFISKEVVNIVTKAIKVLPIRKIIKLLFHVNLVKIADTIRRGIANLNMKVKTLKMYQLSRCNVSMELNVNI
jgi:hypothetical protein